LPPGLARNQVFEVLFLSLLFSLSFFQRQRQSSNCWSLFSNSSNCKDISAIVLSFNLAQNLEKVKAKEKALTQD